MCCGFLWTEKSVHSFPNFTVTHHHSAPTLPLAMSAYGFQFLTLNVLWREDACTCVLSHEDMLSWSSLLHIHVIRQHLMVVLWGQCALRAKLLFSVRANVITLTSDKSVIKHSRWRIRAQLLQINCQYSTEEAKKLPHEKMMPFLEISFTCHWGILLCLWLLLFFTNTSWSIVSG